MTHNKSPKRILVDALIEYLDYTATLCEKHFTQEIGVLLNDEQDMVILQDREMMDMLRAERDNRRRLENTCP